MKLRITLALWLLAAASLYAQDDDSPPPLKCSEYMDARLPAEATQVAAPKTWPGCDSYKLYFGLGRKTDYAAARRCAWAERQWINAQPQPLYTLASDFGVSPMLRVLYSNGVGVERNIDLALRFACEADSYGSVAADIDLWWNTARRNSGRYHLCDRAEDTSLARPCIQRERDIDRQARHDLLHNLSANWSAAQKDALSALIEAEDTYSRLHAGDESDLSGSGHVQWFFMAEKCIGDDFVAALQSFEQGKLPAGSAGTYTAANGKQGLSEDVGSPANRGNQVAYEHDGPGRHSRHPERMAEVS